MVVNGTHSEATATGRVVAVNEKGIRLEGASDEAERERARRRAYYLKNREATIARARAWRLAQSDAYKAYQRAYRERNAERLRARRCEYYQQNRARLDAAHADWKRRNGAEHRAYQSVYRAEHREMLAARRAQYKRENKDVVALHGARRRANKRSAPINDLTRLQWAGIKRAYRQRCAYCGLHTRALTMDHVIPLARRGSHTARNIIPACGPCNYRKRHLAPLPVSVVPQWSDLAPSIWSQP